MAVTLGMLTLAAGTTPSSSTRLTLAGRGVDGVAAAQEDAQLEIKCRQALLSVHAFETSFHIDVQVRQQSQTTQLLITTPLLIYHGLATNC